MEQIIGSFNFRWIIANLDPQEVKIRTYGVYSSSKELPI